MKKTIIIILLIIVIAFVFINVRTMLIKRRYPLEYKQQITKYADEYDVDPYLVCSVIWVESKYDKAAVSEVGAVGLMQVMPETGEWISNKIALEDYDESILSSPAVNIRLGCWYLSYLDERFGANTTSVLAAYNAGPNRVAEWLDDNRYASNRQLNHIPIEETSEYVRRVFKAYEIYETYYTFK
jgi:soluble lytic murein transglycosylase